MSEPMTGEIVDAAQNGRLVATIEREASGVRPASWWPFAIGALATTALAGALIAGTLPRLHRAKVLQAASEDVLTALPRVTAVRAQTATAATERVLPGNCHPLL
jgi:hypothetical protein